MRTSKQVTRIAVNLDSLNSSPKTKARDNSRMLVKAIVFLLSQSATSVNDFGHMEQECPTYLKSIGKSKALAATLSDTKPKENSDDSDQDGIVSSFIATVEFPVEVVELTDEEEELI